MTIRREVLFCLCGIIAAQASLLAQIPTRPGTVEISAYGGGSFDFPGAGIAYGGFSYTNTFNPPKFTPGRKTQPTIGAEVGVSLTRFLWLYGDYAYLFPDREHATASIPLTNTVSLTETASATRHYWAGTGGAELSFPTVHRVVPLVRFGGGYVHQRHNINWPPYNTRVGNIAFVDPGLQILEAESIPAVTFGGGVRWYWSERHGLRVLVTGFRLSHGVTDMGASSAVGGYGFVTRRSGGELTVGYFVHFGR